MRQQHSSISKSDSVSPIETAHNLFQPIMADSVEVMEYFYKGKIQELEQSLTNLTYWTMHGKLPVCVKK